MALSELTGVPASTLWHRDHGRDSIQQRAAKQQRLSPQEEKALVSYQFSHVLICPFIIAAVGRLGEGVERRLH
jgi:hypothetical protein